MDSVTLPTSARREAGSLQTVGWLLRQNPSQHADDDLFSFDIELSENQAYRVTVADPRLVETLGPLLAELGESATVSGTLKSRRWGAQPFKITGLVIDDQQSLGTPEGEGLLTAFGFSPTTGFEFEGGEEGDLEIEDDLPPGGDAPGDESGAGEQEDEGQEEEDHESEDEDTEAHDEDSELDEDDPSDNEPTDQDDDLTDDADHEPQDEQEDLSSPWQNPSLAVDVNGDGRVAALDALLIINYLNTYGPGSWTDQDPALGGEAAGFYPDVTGDGRITALDALQVINVLNARTLPTPPSHTQGSGNTSGDSSGESSGEGESQPRGASASGSAAPPVSQPEKTRAAGCSPTRSWNCCSISWREIEARGPLGCAAADHPMANASGSTANRLKDRAI